MNNAVKKARELIAGFVNYDDLCRYAAHNLAERKQIHIQLNKRPSKARREYLKNSLRALGIEKSMLETKEARIRSKACSEHQFII